MAADISARDPAGLRTDDELVAAARQGDVAALETLLTRYQPQLYRFGLRMCGNADDAGDVAQESLIAMARSLRDFRGEASVSSWLYTIARRFCIRKRRRSKFGPTREESLDVPGSPAADRLTDPAPDPEHTATVREVQAVLAAAIAALDPRHREVLVLRDIEGLSAPEVARVMGISVDAVKSRLHRARLAVRNRVAPLVGVPAAAPRRPRPCPDVLRTFSRHLEGEIDATVCTRMEAHLEQCEDCRGKCESLKQTLALCRELPTSPMPATVAAQVQAALRSCLKRRGAPRSR